MGLTLLMPVRSTCELIVGIRWARLEQELTYSQHDPHGVEQPEELDAHLHSFTDCYCKLKASAPDLCF